MNEKKTKSSTFNDRLEYREYRSASKRKSKNTRHKTKNILHDFTGSPVDEDQFYDIMDDLENPIWSDK
tara:strand:+ start:3414 stop:3617 length:204 start_codon:yes stop_codon:yes gene_type:complete